MATWKYLECQYDEACLICKASKLPLAIEESTDSAVFGQWIRENSLFCVKVL